MYLLDPIPCQKVQYYSIVSPETEIGNEIGQLPPLPDQELLLSRRINCLPFPPTEDGGRLRLVGSCNGLICLASDYVFDSIYIWNPSLKEYFTLPPFSIPCDESYDYHVSFGFGFDATTDDYKVVKLVLDSLHLNWYETEVYHLKKGCWELSRQVAPSCVLYIDNRRDCLNLNGCVHWLGYSRECLDPMIVLFDLAYETFDEISLPDCSRDNDIYDVQLCVLKGQLALFSYGKHHFCDLWIMKAYGEHQVWVKEHAIRLEMLPCLIDRPVGFTASGDFLLVSLEGQLISYNPKSELVKNFWIPPIAHNYLSCYVTYYVDSLVSFATKSYGSRR